MYTCVNETVDYTVKFNFDTNIDICSPPSDSSCKPKFPNTTSSPPARQSSPDLLPPPSTSATTSTVSPSPRSSVVRDSPQRKETSFLEADVQVVKSSPDPLPSATPTAAKELKGNEEAGKCGCSSSSSSFSSFSSVKSATNFFFPVPLCLLVVSLRVILSL